jgi:hypothetical protein
MKNVILLLLFVIGLASCTIEKRKYFKGYHIALRQAQGPGKWGNDQEKQFAESEPQTPLRDDIEAEGDGAIRGNNKTENNVSNAGDTAPAGEILKPRQDDFVITLSHDINTATAKTQIRNTTQILRQHKSHALEGLGTIFLLGIITLVLIVALLLFILTDSAVLAVIGSLILGLIVAIGIYFLLMILFFALLFLIIRSFGS